MECRAGAFLVAAILVLGGGTAASAQPRAAPHFLVPAAGVEEFMAFGWGGLEVPLANNDQVFGLALRHPGGMGVRLGASGPGPLVGLEGWTGEREWRVGERGVLGRWIGGAEFLFDSKLYGWAGLQLATRHATRSLDFSPYVQPRLEVGTAAGKGFDLGAGVEWGISVMSGSGWFLRLGSAHRTGERWGGGLGLGWSRR